MAANEQELTSISSNCPSRGTNCPHLHIPIRLGLYQETTNRQARRCFVLCRLAHQQLLPRGSGHGHVLGRLVRQNREKARLAVRMCRHHDINGHDGPCLQHLDCIGRPCSWWPAQWEYCSHPDHGGRIGYKTGTRASSLLGYALCLVNWHNHRVSPTCQTTSLHRYLPILTFPKPSNRGDVRRPPRLLPPPIPHGVDL